jgi:hypothetical protein
MRSTNPGKYLTPPFLTDSLSDSKVMRHRYPRDRKTRAGKYNAENKYTNSPRLGAAKSGLKISLSTDMASILP